MEFIESLGEMALVTRMRRLAERMHQDNVQIFKEHNIPFEARWFLLLYLLGERAPLSVTDVSKALGITHPTVNQLADEIIRKGFIQGRQDPGDKRRRLLTLTPTGAQWLEAMKILWQDMHAAAREVVDACGYDIIAVLTSIELVLDEESYYDRMLRRVQQREWDDTEIIAYEPAYKTLFQSLNTAWIEAAFTLEPEEARRLKNPEKEILKKGGAIFFAQHQDTVIGTCALLKRDKTVFELAYLAVDPLFQRRQIGKKLIKTALHYAQTHEATALVAEMNHQQVNAINYLRQAGFILTPITTPSPLQRNDTLMHLPIKPVNPSPQRKPK